MISSRRQNSDGPMEFTNQNPSYNIVNPGFTNEREPDRDTIYENPDAGHFLANSSQAGFMVS